MRHQSIKRKYYRMLAALLIGVVILLPCMSIAEVEDRQYKIEAAFLYNFFNYITWPGFLSPQALKQPTICLHNNDPVEPYLDYVQQKRSDERQIRIKEIDEGEKATDCQIVFARDPTAAEIQALVSQHVLVVSEPANVKDDDGMIELIRDNEHMRIRINQPLLEKNKFQISSRLLNIAEVVK